MKLKMLPGPVVRTVITVIAAMLLTLAGLAAAAVYDNKYITKAGITQDYFTLIPEKGCHALVDGWELYPDILLSPDDFNHETPPGYPAQAGRYPNLALFHEDGNPYGISTWRLRIRGSGVMSLYLQEPLCTARVFVNGQDLGGPGEVSQEAYSPLVRDTVYPLFLDGETELIIQTANYSHYYGGLWYAPVIGEPDGIGRLIACRMLLYGLLFFSSLTLSLFCIVLWRQKKTASPGAEFYFGLLSLSFALRICYPFYRFFGAPFVRTLYAVEDVAALSGIYLSFRIILALFLPGTDNRPKSILRLLTTVVPGGMCCAAAVIPLLLIPAFPRLVLWYGPFLSWYKVFASGLMISLTAYGSFKGLPHTKAALAAATANGICLLYNVLSIGYHEPLAGAHPEEYGAFCMVIAFAVLMVRRSREMADENLRLHLHLQEEIREKTDHLQKLLMERGQLIAELGHDMKSPLTSLSNMAQIIRLNNFLLDQDTQKRMLQIEKQCDILSERLKAIQEIAAQTSTPIRLEPTDLNTFLADFYHSCSPIIELYGPNFLKEITSRPCRVMANREKLFRALENLLYNAADFTPPEGSITLSLAADESFAHIIISDNGCGIPKEDLPNIFRRSYTTRSDQGGQGLGLAITRALVLEHGGQIEAVSEVGQGTTFTISLPLLS